VERGRERGGGGEEGSERKRGGEREKGREGNACIPPAPQKQIDS